MVRTATRWVALLLWQGGAARSLDVYGHGGRLYANGQPLHLKGLNWFGQEGPRRVPEGLSKRSLSDLLGWMAAHEFNTLRLYVSLQNVRENKKTPRFAFDAQASPELVGTDYVGMLEAIARVAAANNILVVVANARIRSGYPNGVWPGTWNGNWTDSIYTPQVVHAVWKTLTNRLCTEEHWNLLGVDLLDEPRALGWGEWAAAAEALGDRILDACPKWMVFVQGIGTPSGESSETNPHPNPHPNPMGAATSSRRWGDNLMGASSRPVALSNRSKLIYAPHVSAPSISSKKTDKQATLSDTISHSLRDMWRLRFGMSARAAGTAGAPLVIGAAGSELVGLGAAWAEALIGWAAEREVGLIYSALNPGEGGVLEHDWKTEVVDRIKILQTLPATRVASLWKTKKGVAGSDRAASDKAASASGAPARAKAASGAPASAMGGLSAFAAFFTSGSSTAATATTANGLAFLRSIV